MGWKYINDLNIERPFFNEIRRTMSAKEIKWTCAGETAWEVTCPTCSCKRAVLTTDVKTKSAFVLLCPDKKHCTKRKMYLKELIDLYGTSDMRINYFKQTTQKVGNDNQYGWLPIKYRKNKKLNPYSI